MKANSDFPVQSGRKQLMRFLGLAGNYLRFCQNFIIAEPLTNLWSKKLKCVWSDKCQQAFKQLKANLRNTPVLLALDLKKSFKLAVDASDIGVNAVLLQEDENCIDHPVCYFCKKLNKPQSNYSTTEKECLALILALAHFEVYISSSAVHPVIVFGDHNPLTFIDKILCKNQRLLRWSLMLKN